MRSAYAQNIKDKHMLSDILILCFSFILMMPLSFQLFKRLDIEKRLQLGFCLVYSILVSVLCFNLTIEMTDMVERTVNCGLNCLIQLLLLWLYVYLYQRYVAKNESLHLKVKGFFVFVCLSVVAQIINSIVN